MSRVTIIADPGSCHMGRLAYAKEFIDIAKDIGIDIVKFQLIPENSTFTKNGNVALDHQTFERLWEYSHKKGVAITASIFDESGLDLLLQRDVPYIKLAYSQRKQWWWIKRIQAAHKKLMVSCDFLETSDYPADSIKLMCISQYPVLYNIDFCNKFAPEGPFDGFSDHTMGCGQTLVAVAAGAKYIEKHITLNHDDVRCPDAKFALDKKRFGHMIMEIMRQEAFCKTGYTQEGGGYAEASEGHHVGAK